MPSGFVPNPAFAASLESDPQYRLEVHAQAEHGAENIRHFVHHIMVAKGREEQVYAVTFPEGEKIINYDHGGHLDEWGSKNNPPYAPMRRGLNSAGFRLAEE